MTGREPPFFSQERWCWHTGPLQEEQTLWPLSAASPVLRNWPEHSTLRWTLAETAPSIEQVSGAILPGSHSLQHWGPKGLMSPLPSFPEKKGNPAPHLVLCRGTHQLLTPQTLLELSSWVTSHVKKKKEQLVGAPEDWSFATGTHKWSHLWIDQNENGPAEPGTGAWPPSTALRACPA